MIELLTRKVPLFLAFCFVAGWSSHAAGDPPIVIEPGFDIVEVTSGAGAVDGLAIAPDGTLYFTDYQGGRLLYISDPVAGGAFSVLATGLAFATDVAATSTGRLFVTSSTGSDSTVYEVFADGSTSSFASGFSSPTSIAAFGSDLYVSNSGDGTISRIAADGSVSTFVSGFSAPNGPYGISINSAGTLFFTDHATGNIYSADQAGLVTLLGTLGSALAATFTAIDSSGNLFISDVVAGAVYRLGSSGGLGLFASGFVGKVNPPFIGPTGLAVDEMSNLYAGDGSRIWRISARTQTVEIDIKPDRKTNINVIDLKKDKNLKVAILTEGSFDALQVDPVTVVFGPDGATSSRYQVKDTDRDGDMDFVLIFKTGDTGIACGDTEATLTGNTSGGEAIEGKDSFTVQPCP